MSNSYLLFLAYLPGFWIRSKLLQDFLFVLFLERQKIPDFAILDSNLLSDLSHSGHLVFYFLIKLWNNFFSVFRSCFLNFLVCFEIGDFLDRLCLVVWVGDKVEEC